jgi:hypothetical protein
MCALGVPKGGSGGQAAFLLVRTIAAISRRTRSESALPAPGAKRSL